MNTCPHCHQPVPTEDVSDRQLLAICIVLVATFGIMVCAGMLLARPLFGF